VLSPRVRSFFEAEPNKVDCGEKREGNNTPEQDSVRVSNKAHIFVRGVEGIKDVGCAIVVEKNKFSQFCDFIAGCLFLGFGCSGFAHGEARIV